MYNISPLKDAPFLRRLDLENLKKYYVKILVLDNAELPIRAIEGRVSAGSISIDGNSSVRRSGSITFLAEAVDNDLTDIDNLLSLNKKIQISIGLENLIDDHYERIIWFNQGIFVITNPNITHNTSGVNIVLQFKDKMCLLNGECGGGLPASITFSNYDQVVGYREIEYSGNVASAYPQSPNTYTVYGFKNTANNVKEFMMWTPQEGWSKASYSSVGKVVKVPQRIFDIIQTLVCNYGGEGIANIIIEDIPLELKASVRFVGKGTLYHNTKTGIYTLEPQSGGDWITFNYNEDCGYVYTDFVFPGELISSIGENVCSVLDKIIGVLGNFEYFYDVNGKFVFRETKNHLNTQYGSSRPKDRQYSLSANSYILDEENYYVDFSNSQQSVYTFDEGSALISSYSNTPNYSNIKNDYHIWGKNADGFAIHYHLAIKEKPMFPFNSWKVVAEKDDKTSEYTGKIRLAAAAEVGYDYTPTDWRAELYLIGLHKKSMQQRPNVYEQELLDLFDSIYNMREQKFKADLVNRPNDLKYWFDYINPVNGLHDISIDVCGPKLISQQRDKIVKLYNTDIPNNIIINVDSSPISRASMIDRCEKEGQPYTNVSSFIYKNLKVGTIGYTAQETARELLYKNTDFTSAINISCIPIYYLDVNSRITVRDRAAGIFGDYIVKSINLPLDASGMMTISATRALERR